MENEVVGQQDCTEHICTLPSHHVTICGTAAETSLRIGEQQKREL
jgi:hypothetical protein